MAQSNTKFERLVDENFKYANDDKRAKTLSYLQYGCVVICLTCYLVVLLPAFFDKNENQATSTNIVAIDEYPFPFVYFFMDNSEEQRNEYPSMAITSISIQFSQKYNDWELQSTVSLHQDVFIHPTIKNVPNTFTTDDIDRTSTEWIVYNISSFGQMRADNIFIVIPPWTANNVPTRQKIQIVFNTNGKFFNDPNAVLWAADSLDKLSNPGIFDRYGGWGLKYQEYDLKAYSSGINTGHRVYLDLFESQNKIDGTSNHFYKSTVDDYYFPVYIPENDFIPNVDPNYPMSFYLCFSLNTWGDGVKTLMVTQPKETILDVLAKVGGIWGIVMSIAAFVFSNALVYGIYIGNKQVVPGFAKNAGLSDREKSKIKRFLEEEGYQKN